ncbi:TetR/AcrR family transcriptional regulator [Fictibacillus nanhaiensis]|jgi:AcrR family transcriptional regulator|uniref:TetR/AcrR family transcriptional regulator n=1 Tax=Fictibacillus nanhaiensis TaxID=742169 RepID=UPI00203B7AB2|nr:TetR/AcrR family transcriptional regulator [Fictibacillus nanhaiensis]MCM3733728.1 TetR/AcrR family transcriptional regulator [Fictibacillus nanhaiensis]
MKANIPIPGTIRERILNQAITDFGAHGFEGVNVQQLAKSIGVTTGALYHHFGNKLELYRIVREEVERRIISRMEGASAVHEQPILSIKAAMIVGFDSAVKLKVCTLLSEQDPSDNKDLAAILFKEILNEEIEGMEVIISACWRASLKNVAKGMNSEQAKKVLIKLLEKF